MGNKLPSLNENEVEVQKNHDFTPFDEKAIKEFEDAGLPGITTVDETAAIAMMELYLSGKTYREIARITRRPKAMILYLSQKFAWYPKRMEYLRDLEETMIQRTMEAKLVGQDFLLQMKQYFEKKIGSKITNYLATNDENFAKEINLKEVDKYIKTFEALEKLTSVRTKVSKGENPTVGLNVGDGVTITKVGDNSVEVTPKQKAIGDMLKELADFRRDESSRKEVSKTEKNKDSNEGESNESS